MLAWRLLMVLHNQASARCFLEGTGMPRTLLDFNPEAHGVIGERLLFGGEALPPARKGAIGRVEELDFATMFLEAHRPLALVRVVKGLVGRISSTLGHPLDAPTADRLVANLVRAADVIRAALPSGPGGAAASARGQALFADRIFGTEMEGLSSEDRELEAARRFVRFAAAAVGHASLQGAAHAPAVVATNAALAAARRHAPGLLSSVFWPEAGFRRRRAARHRTSIRASQ
jgi:hypothetical protein